MDGPQLPKQGIYLYRTLRFANLRPFAFLLATSALAGFGACTTMHAPQMKHFEFPKGLTFVGDVKRPYTKLGQVRTKVNFTSLDWVHEEAQLCRNYYNKAAYDLYKRSKEQGGDAVIDLRSVVMLENGEVETHTTPECSDDGQEGQILLEGIAIKWVKGTPTQVPSPLPTPAASPMAAPAL